MRESAQEPSDSGRRLGSAGIVLGCLVAVFLLTSAVGALSAPVDDVLSDGIEVTLGSAQEDEEIDGGGSSGSSGLLWGANETRVDSEIFTNASTDLRFVAETGEPTNWRVSAYDEYQGDRWVRSGTPPAPENPPANETRPVQSSTVTFRTSARVVPAPWRPIETYERPAAVSADGESGLKFSEPVAAGDTIEVTSLRPSRKPRSLHTAGTDYPRLVEYRYTQLPRDVPSRVHRQVDNLTADVDSPFATAVTLESWFRQNYEYDRNASLSGNYSVETLLFDREAGNSPAFATAMTVMLRSRDVPARYVVGYRPGSYNVSAEHYEVRGTDAHAWVEVFFPDHGWVPFDPTPGIGQGDESSDNSSAENTRVGGYRSGDEAPLEDLITRNNGTSQDSRNTTNQTEQDGSPEETTDKESNKTKKIKCDAPNQMEDTQGELHCLELLNDPIPGNNVTVAALIGESPAPDVPVTVDGEYVGYTDRNGRLNATVPFNDSITLAGYKRFEYLGGLDPSDEPHTVRDFAVPTNLNLTVYGTPHPGSSVTLRATINNTSVPTTNVYLEDRLVDRTDSDGNATLDLPDATGQVSVRAERGAVDGETVINLSDVEMTVDAWPAILPGREATVTVTYDNGDPAASIPIYQNGKPVATTDADGRATISPDATFQSTVSARGVSWQVTVTIHPLVNLTYALIPVVVLVFIAALLARRLGFRPFDRAATGVLQSLDAVLTGLVVASSGLDRALRSLVGGSEGDDHGVLAVLRRLVGLPLATLLWVGRLPRRLVGRVSTRGATEGDRGADAGADGASDDADVIRRAWDRLIGLLPVSRPEVHTPADLAERAIRAGFPRGAVETILDAFRRVEYGGQEPDDVGEEPVQQALGELEGD